MVKRNSRRLERHHRFSSSLQEQSSSLILFIFVSILSRIFYMCKLRLHLLAPITVSSLITDKEENQGLYEEPI